MIERRDSKKSYFNKIIFYLFTSLVTVGFKYTNQLFMVAKNI